MNKSNKYIYVYLMTRIIRIQQYMWYKFRIKVWGISAKGTFTHPITDLPSQSLLSCTTTKVYQYSIIPSRTENNFSALDLPYNSTISLWQTKQSVCHSETFFTCYDHKISLVPHQPVFDGKPSKLDGENKPGNEAMLIPYAVLTHSFMVMNLMKLGLPQLK